MRVSTAFLVVASSQTAVEFGLSTGLQKYDHDAMAAGNAVATTLSQQFRRESREVHDDLAPTAADEERGGTSVVSIDAQQAIKAITDVLTKASVIDHVEKLPVPPGDLAASVDTSHNWLRKEWIAMAEEYDLPTSMSKESPEIQGEVHAAGHPDTSGKRKHFPSIFNKQAKRQRLYYKSLEEIRAEVQNKLPSDTAATIDTSHGLLSNMRLISSPEIWAKDINMEPQQPIKSPVVPRELDAAGQHDNLREQGNRASLLEVMKQSSSSTQFTNHRALPPGKKGPQGFNPVPALDSTKRSAMHDKFSELCSPTYNPTEAETVSLWSMMKYGKIKDIRSNLERIATRYVVRDMMDSLDFDSAWKTWVRMTPSEKAKLLDNVLNGHNRRWIWMYNKFKQARPDLPSITTSSEPTPKDFLSDLGKSSEFAGPVHGKSQNPRLGVVTSSEPITKDFLSNLGKSSEFAGPVHEKSQNPRSGVATSSELTTKDFLTSFGKSGKP